MGGRGRPGSGVEPRAETIRISFTWSGKRRRENLDLKPTAANIKAAEKLVAQINAEIRAGVFDYARHFPDSRAALHPTGLTTFKEYAARWLKTLTTDAGTAKNYRSSIEQVWNVTDGASETKLGVMAITDIKHSDIKAAVATRAGMVSGKTVNNDLIPLRAVFEAAVEDELIRSSPVRLIKNLKHQTEPPDPFTLEEMERILAHLKARAPVQVWAYYETAFMTGLRPSEQIVVRWSKLDRGEQSLRIDTARTRNREKSTKTHSVRDVDLSTRALAAIDAMKAYTFLKDADAPIFCHPVTGKPWTNDQYQRVTYFHPALKALGIRKRDAYQTRHTFATVALMGGVAPAYIARQLGHVNAAMLFKTYGKWIDRADKGREADKLAALYSGNLSRISPRENLSD